jgi:hypothetical protein
MEHGFMEALANAVCLGMSGLGALFDTGKKYPAKSP